MRKILAVTVMLVLGLAGVAHAYTDAEIAEFARARDIRVAIEKYLHAEIYPPRIYRSSTITNLHNFHGELEQKIDVNLETKSCSVKLVFSKGGIVWEVASEFLMKSVEEILSICRKNDFKPTQIVITIYTDATNLLGTGTYTANDNMIRSIPPEQPKKNKRSIKK